MLAVKAPGYGDRRKEMLEDIAILTGGTVISDELGYELKDATMDMLGRAKSVKVQKENTIIVDGIGDLLKQFKARVGSDQGSGSTRPLLISIERNYRKDWRSYPAVLQLSA